MLDKERAEKLADQMLEQSRLKSERDRLAHEKEARARRRRRGRSVAPIIIGCCTVVVLTDYIERPLLRFALAAAVGILFAAISRLTNR